MQKKNSFRKGIVLTPGDFEGVDWIKDMKNSGLNTLGLHSGGGEAHDVVTSLGFLGEQSFRTELSNTGIDFEYEVHASANLLSRALFTEHPEYFPCTLRSEERMIHGNWCTSEPEAMRLVAENAVKLAKGLPPSTNRFFFWGADATANDWCNCEKCAGLTPSDQSLKTSNMIAKRLKTDIPEAMVCFLAYHTTLQAPRIEKPEQNVFAEFAPYFRCYKHSICDSGCAINRMHLKYLFDLLELFSPGKVHILEYWLDSTLFGFCCHPPHRSPFCRKIAEDDIRFYASLGIRSITTFAVRQNGEYRKVHGNREFLEYAEILSSI